MPVFGANSPRGHDQYNVQNRLNSRALAARHKVGASLGSRRASSRSSCFRTRACPGRISRLGELASEGGKSNQPDYARCGLRRRIVVLVRGPKGVSAHCARQLVPLESLLPWFFGTAKQRRAQETRFSEIALPGHRRQGAVRFGAFRPEEQGRISACRPERQKVWIFRIVPRSSQAPPGPFHSPLDCCRQ
jgi:hypothetical protein